MQAMLDLRRRAPFVALVAAALILATPLPAAAWSAGTSSDGQGWSITNGSVEIPMANERIAERTAKRMNRAERKAEKAENQNGDGVVDNGDGNCGGAVLC